MVELKKTKPFERSFNINKKKEGLFVELFEASSCGVDNKIRHGTIAFCFYYFANPLCYCFWQLYRCIVCHMVTTVSSQYPYCIKSSLVGISKLEELTPFTLCLIGKSLSITEPSMDTIWSRWGDGGEMNG